MNKLFAFCFVEYKNSTWADLLISSIRKYYDVPIYLTTASAYKTNVPDVNIFNNMAKWPEYGFPESNHTIGLEFLVNKIKSFINRCTKTTYVGIIPRHHGSETVFDHEKFAELIVKECVVALEVEIDTWKEMDPYQGSMKRKSTTAIKEHFGVE